MKDYKTGLKLPADVKAKWVEALRSGKYKQGKDLLKTRKGEYCCLGVLQMVTIGDVETFPNGNYRGVPSTAYCEQWLGDPYCDFSVSYNRDRAFLPDLNDRIGLSFDDLAKLIEDQVETY